MTLCAQVIGITLPLSHFLQLVRGFFLYENGMLEMFHNIWSLLLCIAVA